MTFAARALGVLLREVAPDAGAPLSPRAPSAILTLAPGETHELGADVVASLFRLAGWRVERCESAELAGRLAGEAFDVAGFSLSCDALCRRAARRHRRGRARRRAVAALP